MVDQIRRRPQGRFVGGADRGARGIGDGRHDRDADADKQTEDDFDPAHRFTHGLAKAAAPLTILVGLDELPN